MIDRRRPQFIAWDHHVPALLPDVDAVVRWGQARMFGTFDAWVLNDVLEQCVQVSFQRTSDTEWTLTEPDGRSYTVPADPSDHPIELQVIDTFTARPWRGGRVPKTEWRTHDDRDPLGLYGRYGFLPPQPNEPGWSVFYCPELMAEQMAWLTNHQILAYLTGVDLRLIMHLRYRDLGPAEREAEINSRLCDEGLAALTTEVQMRAMELSE